MQPVCNLDQYHADVLTDGQQQLTEVLRLFRGLVTEHTAADLCQTTHDLRNLVSEQTRDVLLRIVRIFDHVVQQGRTDTRRAQTYVPHTDARDSKRVHNIRFAAQATHAIVRLVRKVKRMRDQLHFLTVGSMRVVVQQRLKLALDHQILFRCKLAFLHTKPKSGAKLQLFFHICKRTRVFLVFLSFYPPLSCIYQIFFVPLQTNSILMF